MQFFHRCRNNCRCTPCTVGSFGPPAVYIQCRSTVHESASLHSPSTGVGNDASIVFHARVLMGSHGVLLRLKSVK